MGSQARTDVRGLSAGTGASGSFVAAAIVAIATVSAFVAFEDLPFADDTDRDGAIVLGGNGPTAVSGTVGSGRAGSISLDPAPDSAGGEARRARGPLDRPRGATGENRDRRTQPPDGASPAGAQPAAVGSRSPVDGTVAGVGATVVAATGIAPDVGDATSSATASISQATTAATDVADRAVSDLTAGDIGGQLDMAAPIP